MLRPNVIYVDKLTYCSQGTYLLIRWFFLSCDSTANRVKKCYLSASIKDWSHSQISPLAFTITASISLGKNIFPSLRSLIATFRIDISGMLFRLPAVVRLFRPTFAENDN